MNGDPTGVGPIPRTPDGDDVFHRELDPAPGDGTHEVAHGRVTVPPRDLTGIALSGGGIRSATFNLGLLQGLARFGILDRLDYLSTVSGGGYIGSAWSAWRAREREGDRGSPFHSPEPPGASSEAPPPGSEPGRPRDPVDHLRAFSNFLAPRLGLLSWDTGRMVVTVVSSMVPSLAVALAVLTLALVAWCLLALALLAPELPISSLAFLVLTALLLGGMESRWRRLKEEVDPWGYGEAWGMALLGAVLLWLLVGGVLGEGGPDGAGLGAGMGIPVIGEEAPPSDWLLLLAPVGAWIGASLVLTFWRLIRSRWTRSHLRRVRRNAYDRVHARLLLLAAGWTVVSLLWWVGALVWGLVEQGFEVEVGTGLVGTTGVVVYAFSRVQKRLSGEFTSSLGTTLLARLKPVLPQVLAYLAIALLVVMAAAATVGLGRSDPAIHPLALLGGGALLILALAVLFFDPNEVGLHTFYRARISRAYLGASNPEPDHRWRTEERRDDDVSLAALPATGPCHLICCAANDLSARDLGALHRGARSAVLSPVGFSVGGARRAWEADDRGSPTLSAAATASAAAFNPLMGDRSRSLGPAVTFLMAAFNLRLGMWLPGVPLRDRGSRLRRALVGLPFFREMFGLARADGSEVHLSDGGHFENMAVYELIRRHCRFILAADCGMDPSVGFNDVGNLVRRVRTDFGVDIRIDLSPLRPDASGVSRQSMVAGDIHYPEGDTGILLLVKPSITGSEPPDVAQYRTRNPVFPHESTGDQFYDEAQWESYRRLGEYVAHSAFHRISRGLEGGEGSRVHELFLRARREWQPVPEGFGERLSRVADAVGDIDALLRDRECRVLRREVFRELVDWEEDPEGESREPGAAGDGTPPANAEMGATLHLLRRALSLMEEVYTRENLEERAHHPLHLGLMNYFARWTSAPLFRMWWPVLKTMHPQPFTRFMERQFGLRPAAGQTGSLSPVESPGVSGEGPEGFAMSAWRREHPGPPVTGRLVLPWKMELRYGGRVVPFQAAQVLVARAGSHLVWDAGDFYVPPGLWGVGIGQQFLRALRRTPPPEVGPHGRLFVRIPVDPDEGAAGKTRIANEIQLYRSAGFLEVLPRELPEGVAEALDNGVFPDGDTEPPGGEEARDNGKARWMASPDPVTPPP